MQIVVKKWGNCAAVRLPAAVMKAAGLAVDQPVEVEEHEGIITLRPVVRRRRRSLEELIAATPSFDRLPGWLDEDVGRESGAFR
jgi:antitoxin MazE